MLDALFSTLHACVPALFTVVIVVTGLTVANWLLFHRRRDLSEENLFHGRIVMLLLAVLGVVLVLVALPLNATTESGLFTLLGLLLTAVIALSSTTFVANAMAGWMLRAVRSFGRGQNSRGAYFRQGRAGGKIGAAWRYARQACSRGRRIRESAQESRPGRAVSVGAQNRPPMQTLGSYRQDNRDLPGG